MIKDKKICNKVSETFRRAALKMICAYRTVLHPMAAILARIPFASGLKQVYLKVKKVINTKGFIIPQVRKMIRNEECIRAIEKWKRNLLALSRGILGFRVKEILVTDLLSWIDRR